MTKEEYFFKHPQDNTIEKINNLIGMFGANVTLGDVKTSYLHWVKNRGHICPKCNGRGYIVTEYNRYPQGLPDSGWVYEPGYDYNECDLCKGKGYTRNKYVPKTETKIIGYEIED